MWLAGCVHSTALAVCIMCFTVQQGPEAFEPLRMSVANNACWAIGELAAKVRMGMRWGVDMTWCGIALCGVK